MNLFCNQHDIIIDRICLHSQCPNRRPMCKQCIINHKQHITNTYPIDQLDEFLQFYTTKDAWCERVIQYTKEYKLTIYKYLEQIETLTIRLLQQRDISNLDRGSTLQQLDVFASKLCKLVYNSQGKICRISLDHIEQQLTKSHQEIIEKQVSTIDWIVKEISQINILEPGVSASFKPFVDPPKVGPFSPRFIISDTLHTRDIQIQDDFTARGQGTVILIPSFDSIFSDNITVKFEVQGDFALGVCTINKQKPMSLFDRVWLIQSDGYTIPDSIQTQFKFGQITQVTYDKQHKELRIQSDQCHHQMKVELIAGMHFCASLRQTRLKIYNVL